MSFFLRARATRPTSLTTLRNSVVAGVAALALVGTGALPAVAAAPAGVVSGTVTATDGGTPVEGVRVGVMSVDGGVSHDAFTDAEGHYAVEDLEPGDYTVHFDSTGTDLISEYWDGVYQSWEATTVTVGDGEVVEGISAALEEGGAITGRVTRESTGEPLEGVQVRASASQVGESWAITDADGEYRIGDLRTAANYKVTFDAPSDTFVDEFWDGVFDIEDAVDIAVTEGLVTEGIDASLLDAAEIHGSMVRESDGSPVEGEVFAGQGGRFGGTSTTVEADGTFIAYVAPGSYALSFLPADRSLLSEFWDDARTVDDATRIDVEAGQVVTGIHARLEAGLTISGTVTSGGEPIEGVSVWAYGDTTAGDDTTTAADGTYTLVLREGTYKLEAKSSFDAPIYATTYYDGAWTLDEATPLTLEVGGDLTGIDFDLVRGADIRGHVSLAGGGTPDGEGATVIAYRWTADGWVEYDRIPSWGTFSFSPNRDIDGGTLPPGVYTIAVEYPGYCTQFYGEATSAGEAESFEVSAGQVLTDIDVTLSTECGPAAPKIAVSSASVRAGGSVEVTGSGFVPGETIAFVLHSDPIALGELVADEDGAVSGALTIPASAPVGAHELVALGDESAVEARVALTVTAAATVPSGSLANTGSEFPGALAMSAVMLLVAGAVLVRRRRVRA